MNTRKLTLPIFEAIEACAAVLPHVATDPVTPVITVAHITGDTITATDRYTVGRFNLSQALDEGSIALPLEAVKWLARFVTKHLLEDVRMVKRDTYTVTIEAPEPTELKGPKAAGQSVTVSVESKNHGVEVLRKFRPVGGNFPPVGRLLDGHKPAEAAPTVALGSEQLEKFTGYAKKWHRGHPLTFTLSATDNPGKPGPVLIKIGEQFTGLLQPNLLLR